MVGDVGEALQSASVGEPRISVIVPTRDRSEDLARCLASVLACEHDSFELIVVDQSKPAALVPHDSRIIHLPTDTHGKSSALNLGIATARAELIAFTDDDCTVPPDWLNEVEEIFARLPDVALAYGELRPVPHDPAQQFVPDAPVDGSEKIFHDTWRGRLSGGGAGANMAARRRMFDAMGLFDEQIGPGSRFPASEELDLYYRALASGHAVAVVPKLTATHWGVRSWADGSGRTLLRSYAYGKGAVIGKHLRMGARRAAIVAAGSTAQDLRLVAHCIRLRQTNGLGLLPYKWRGLAVGLTAPVDRSRHVFADSAAKSA